jgi:hypothetical protein
MDNPLREILRKKDLKNPYLLVGLLGRIANNNVRRGNERLVRTTDRLVGMFALKSFGEASETVQADYWHGTGRYQYSNGEVVDVLKGIAEQGALLPNYDAFDLNRPMTSVSLAKQRMYARAYADMHGQGSGETDRHGSSLFWASIYLGDIAVEAAREAEAWKPIGYKRMMDHLRTGSAAEWYKKVTRTNTSVVDLYGSGSDIEGNYPMLFGIRTGIDLTDTSRAVGLHEVRTESSIPLDLVTHVEVPRGRVEETRVIIGIPVIAIEDGEAYSSLKKFSEHLM